MVFFRMALSFAPLFFQILDRSHLVCCKTKVKALQSFFPMGPSINDVGGSCCELQGIFSVII